MDQTELISADFWSGTRPVVLAPPRLAGDAGAMEAALTAVPWAAGGVVFASSGSSGPPKWILLKKSALAESAREVNAYLQVTGNDVWLLALPAWHVGGFGVVARAREAGCRLEVLENSWDPERFVQQVEHDRVTCTSLVPTQVHDLVAAGLTAPSCLRVVVVGGGALPLTTGQRARELGWPALQSYGMTETASQVATEPLERLVSPFSGTALTVLPGWEVETDREGRLRVRGDALFDGYLEWDGKEVRLRDEREDRWFTTTDRVQLNGRQLSFEGRVDRVVKILGELVDVAALEGRFGDRVGDQGSFALVVLEDERAGARLVPVVAGDAVDWTGLVDDFNRDQPGFARLAPPVTVSKLPRTALGKPDLQALRDLAQESCASGLPSDGNSN